MMRYIPGTLATATVTTRQGAPHWRIEQGPKRVADVMVLGYEYASSGLIALDQSPKNTQPVIVKTPRGQRSYPSLAAHAVFECEIARSVYGWRNRAGDRNNWHRSGQWPQAECEFNKCLCGTPEYYFGKLMPFTIEAMGKHGHVHDVFNWDFTAYCEPCAADVAEQVAEQRRLRQIMLDNAARDYVGSIAS